MSMVPKYLMGYNETRAAVVASLAQLQVRLVARHEHNTGTTRGTLAGTIRTQYGHNTGITWAPFERTAGPFQDNGEILRPLSHYPTYCPPIPPPTTTN